MVPLLKTCKNVYENSSFYKEARIVSFIDRLVECLTSKLKTHVSMRGAVMAGVKSDENYKKTIESAVSICLKFQDAFFIKKLMSEPNPAEKLEESKDATRSGTGLD